MSYIKVLNSEYDVAEKLFSIIHDLQQTPCSDSFLTESKLFLRKLLMSTPKQQTTGYDFYKTKNITYYQNGLCIYNEQAIDLGSFGEELVEEKEVKKDVESAMKIAKEIENDYPVVFYQLINYADPTYKFKQLYAGRRGSFERIINNCEILKKEFADKYSGTNDRKKEMYEENKKIAENIIKLIVRNNTIAAIATKDIECFVKTKDFSLIQTKKLDNTNFVEAGIEILNFFYKFDNTTINILERIRLLDRS